MDRNTPEGDIITRVISELESASEGSQELDCMISYALELARGEFDQVMMELLVKEGFSWNVISEIWGGKVPPYTQSLDCGLEGENIAFAMRSDKRQQWAAVHKSTEGKEFLAWAKTEVLARRLAALKGSVAESVGQPEKGPSLEPGKADQPEDLGGEKEAEHLRMVPPGGHSTVAQAAAARDTESWTVLF